MNKFNNCINKIITQNIKKNERRLSNIRFRIIFVRNRLIYNLYKNNV